METRDDRDLDNLDVDDLLKLSEQPRKRRKVYEDNPETYGSASEGSEDSFGKYEDDNTHLETEAHIGGSLSASDEEDDKVRMKNVNTAAQTPKRSKDEGRFQVQDNIPKASKANEYQRKTFHELGVSKVLVASLTKMSIRKPTEVQAACIPPLLAGLYSLCLISLKFYSNNKL